MFRNLLLPAGTPVGRLSGVQINKVTQTWRAKTQPVTPAAILVLVTTRHKQVDNTKHSTGTARPHKQLDNTIRHSCVSRWTQAAVIVYLRRKGVALTTCTKEKVKATVSTRKSDCAPGLRPRLKSSLGTLGPTEKTLANISDVHAYSPSSNGSRLHTHACWYTNAPIHKQANTCKRTPVRPQSCAVIRTHKHAIYVQHLRVYTLHR